MNASAGGAVRPDIRVGDLVKATRREDPEISFTARVRSAGGRAIQTSIHSAAHYDFWDFEVLDRPLPPIDEELLAGAIDVYRRKRGFPLLINTDHFVAGELRRAFTEAINFVRDYDQKNATKENA